MSRYMADAVGGVLGSTLTRARALEEPGQPKVAIRDQRPHAARLSQGQGLTVVRFAALGVEAVGMDCDVAEEVARQGGARELMASAFDTPSCAKTRPKATRPRGSRT